MAKCGKKMATGGLSDMDIEPDMGSISPKKPAPKPKKMAKGGSASSRADGCAQRGKTRGTFM